LLRSPSHNFIQITIYFPYTYQFTSPPLIHFIQSLFITLPICSLSTPLASPGFHHMRFTFFSIIIHVCLFSFAFASAFKSHVVVVMHLQLLAASLSIPPPTFSPFVVSHLSVNYVYTKRQKTKFRYP